LDGEIYEKVSLWFNRLELTFTEWSKAERDISIICHINSWKVKEISWSSYKGLTRVIHQGLWLSICGYVYKSICTLNRITHYLTFRYRYQKNGIGIQKNRYIPPVTVRESRYCSSNNSQEIIVALNYRAGPNLYTTFPELDVWF